jgi:hypothetical protein
MQLASHLGDAAAQLSDELADTIDYSPDGVAPPVTIVAIVGREETRPVLEQDGEKSRYVRTVHLPITAAAAGGGEFIPSIELRSQLIIKGWIYVVEAILSKTPNWIHLEAHRLAIHEKTRQGYRRKG